MGFTSMETVGEGHRCGAQPGYILPCDIKVLETGTCRRDLVDLPDSQGP